MSIELWWVLGCSFSLCKSDALLAIKNAISSCLEAWRSQPAAAAFLVLHTYSPPSFHLYMGTINVLLMLEQFYSSWICRLGRQQKPKKKSKIRVYRFSQIYERSLATSIAREVAANIVSYLYVPDTSYTLL